MLGPGYQMCEVGCIWVKPGAPASGLHPDIPPSGWFARHLRPIPDLCFVLSGIWMLTDFTGDNAARLWPFSHLQTVYPRPQAERNAYDHAVVAEAPAGSLLIMRASLWHQAPANTSGRDRYVVSCGYRHSWLDPLACGWALMNRPVRDRLPSAARDLINRVADP